MAETTTTRLGLRRWSAGTDTPSRAEFDNDNAQLELLGAIDKQDIFGNRPAAGVRGTYFWDTTNEYTWRDNGSAWKLVGQNTQDATVKSSGVGVVPLTVNAITSQTANLLDLKVNGVAQFSVTAAGSPSGNIFTGKSASFTNDTNGNAVIFGKGSSGQTANLLTLQNNAGTNQFSVSPTGLITSTGLATTGSGTATGAVVNATTATNVAGMSFWTGTPSFEVRMNRSGGYSDFMLLKHDDPGGTVVNRVLGILMKSGAEDAGGAAKTAALYLRSTTANFGDPSFRIDVQDTAMWEMKPSSVGSVTPYPVFSNGGYFRAAPSGTAAYQAGNTYMGVQGSSNNVYYRVPTISNVYNWYANGAHSDTANDAGASGVQLMRLSGVSAAGQLEVGRLRLTAISDADASTTTPTLGIGPLSGQNLMFDDNEIMGVNNGSLTNGVLALQGDGGRLQIGGANTKTIYNNIGFYVSNDGTTPPSPVTGELWLDGRLGGGVKRYVSGNWQLL